MAAARHDLGNLAKAAVRRFYEDRGFQVASSLTFTTLLSIVPILTVALTLMTAFPVFGDLLFVVRGFLIDHIIPESAWAIETYAEGFIANAAKLTAVGMVFLAVTAVLLLMTIDSAFNDIWRANRRRPLLQRLVVYWTLITVGPVLVGGSMSLTSWLVTRSLRLLGEAPATGVFLLQVLPLLLTVLALSLLYLLMPVRKVALRDAVVGGVFAGLAFEAMKRGFAVYLAWFPTHELVYGAFASLPILLMWIYCSWMVVLLGAVLVAVLPDWRCGAEQEGARPGSDFVHALQIMKALWMAQRAATVVMLPQLLGRAKLRAERVEHLLDRMEQAAWVSRTAAGGWVLQRDPAVVTVEDVFRLFVLGEDRTSGSTAADQQLADFITGLSADMAQHMQSSLEDVFRGRDEKTSENGAADSGPRAGAA